MTPVKYSPSAYSKMAILTEVIANNVAPASYQIIILQTIQNILADNCHLFIVTVIIAHFV